jgi:hypothetical protein
VEFKLPEDFESEAEFVAAQAYQVIGALAARQDVFEHPEVERAMDYFAYEGWKRGWLLPWPEDMSLIDVIVKRVISNN